MQPQQTPLQPVPVQPAMYGTNPPYPHDPYAAPAWGAPAAALKQSGFGISALVLSILIGITQIITVLYAGYLETTTPGGISEESPVAIMVGLVILGGMLGNVIGLILACVALSIRDRAKACSILGLVFNLLGLFAVGGLMVIGLLAG